MDENIINLPSYLNESEDIIQVPSFLTSSTNSEISTMATCTTVYQTCGACETGAQCGSCQHLCQDCQTQYQICGACETSTQCGTCQHYTQCGSCESTTQCDNCESSCQTQCEVICENVCEGYCQTSCEGACQDQCETTCENCQGGCETNCENGCQFCLTTCETYCQNCQGNCETLCEKFCETACEQGCESCEGCEGECMLSCEGECQTNSELACSSTACQSLCETLCENACEGYCETECERCMASCQSASQGGGGCGTVQVVNKWEWSTEVQTSIDSKGAFNVLKSGEMNMFVSTLKEALRKSNVDGYKITVAKQEEHDLILYGRDCTYAEILNRCIFSVGESLTAKKFNTIVYCLGQWSSLSISKQNKGDAVMGEYFNKLKNSINKYLDKINIQ